MIKFNGITSNKQYYRRNPVFEYRKVGHQYLTLENIHATVQAYIHFTNPYSSGQEYSLDGGSTWNSINDDTLNLILAPGESVKFRTTIDQETEFSEQEHSAFSIFSTEDYYSSDVAVKVSGDPRSLHYVDFENANTLAPYEFESLFKECYGLTHAGGLILDAITTSEYSYQSMFKSCHNLVVAPEINTKHFLGRGSCQYMFLDCQSLTTPPSYVGTADGSIEDFAFYEMFAECTSLVNAPALPCTTFVTKSDERAYYRGMFRGCWKLITAPPILPATTIYNEMYLQMFSECWSLVNAPIIAATTMDMGGSSHCAGMFYNCTSLETAPDINIAVIPYAGLNDMFNSCTSLNYIKCLATDISGDWNTVNWVFNVAANGTFVKAASMEDWEDGSWGIPSGWTVVDAS